MDQRIGDPFGFRGAVGARFTVYRHWAVRVDGSLFLAEPEIVEAPFTWLQASIGVGYRF